MNENICVRKDLECPYRAGNACGVFKCQRGLELAIADSGNGVKTVALDLENRYLVEGEKAPRPPATPSPSNAIPTTRG